MTAKDSRRGSTISGVRLPEALLGGVLAAVEPPAPEHAAQIDKLLSSAMASVLGRPFRQPLEASGDQELVEDVYDLPAVRSATAHIKAHIDRGLASVSLLAAWRRHLFAVQHCLARGGTSDRRRGLANVAYSIAECDETFPTVEVEEVQSLGSAVASAAFVGPERTRIILSRDAYGGEEAAKSTISELILNARDARASGEFACLLRYNPGLDADQVDVGGRAASHLVTGRE